MENVSVSIVGAYFILENENQQREFLTFYKTFSGQIHNPICLKIAKEVIN